MFMVVTGGSGSGKSAFAEEQLTRLESGGRYYIATMQCADEESRRRVLRHRAMRADKHFHTLECPVGLSELALPSPGSALLECMSNLAANEFFDGGRHTPEETADKILLGLRRLKAQCRHLIVVTNEVFSDGCAYEKETRQYLECLGSINCAMSQEADCVAEVVYGIALPVKGGWQ